MAAPAPPPAVRRVRRKELSGRSAALRARSYDLLIRARERREALQSALERIQEVLGAGESISMAPPGQSVTIYTAQIEAGHDVLTANERVRADAVELRADQRLRVEAAKLRAEARVLRQLHRATAQRFHMKPGGPAVALAPKTV